LKEEIERKKELKMQNAFKETTLVKDSD
jgi:hypothetical protein